MKVFEACMTVIKRRIVTFIVYFAVFIGLAVMLTALSGDQFTTDFSALRPNFTVINRDGDSLMAGGLINYLGENGIEVAIEDDMSALQDATFFRATDYIVIIPQGFRESFFSGDPMTLETVKTTSSASGYYVDSMVNQYLNQARIRLLAGNGLSEDELVAAVLGDLSLEAVAVKKHFGVSAPLDESYRLYNQLLCYILMVLTILCVTNITIVFRRPDLRMRNLCSPLKPRSLTGQQMLSGAILGALAWLLMSIVGLVLFGGNLGDVDNRTIALVLLNSLVFTAVAMSLATLSGSFVRGANAQNAVANIMSLGMCFLGGVFVPLSMLGEGILAVARFLPTYWNMTALDRISDLTSYEAAALAPVWQALLIQAAFAAAIFCVTLALGKCLSQSERSFSGVKTEISAFI